MPTLTRIGGAKPLTAPSPVDAPTHPVFTPRRCSICGDPRRRQFVDRKIAEGANDTAISRDSRLMAAADAGVSKMKALTISKHRRVCLTQGVGERVAPAVRAEVAVMSAKVREGLADANDLALLIRDAVAEKVRVGEVRLTAQHGLTAQAQLDRRAEKQAGREVLIRMTRLLLGIGPPAEVLPARDVTPPSAVVIEHDDPFFDHEQD